MSLSLKIKWGVLVFLTLVTCAVWYAVILETPNGYLKVFFLDIGQGDAIFIEAPNGNQILVDGGNGKRVLRELGKVLPFYDRSIDLVIATHPDLDHIGGLPFVIERYKVGGLMEPGTSSDTVGFQSLEEKIIQTNTNRIEARRGMKVIIDKNITFNILFPDRDPEGLEPNDSSIVGILTYGETEFLLTGDSPKKIENYLSYLDGANLEADVLKVGHHGSKTSTSQTFADLVKPKFAIISAGKDNRFGHPHKEVIQILESVDAEILSTAERGTIKMVSDGQKVVVEN